jgi:hypothetical protein
MIKTIKLTESDLTRIVKRVISEQESNGKELEFILVKNFLKTINPQIRLEINNYKNLDILFENFTNEKETLDTLKQKYMNWLVKNGFQKEDIYVNKNNMGRIQEVITKKGLK